MPIDYFFIFSIMDIIREINHLYRIKLQSHAFHTRIKNMTLELTKHEKIAQARRISNVLKL